MTNETDIQTIFLPTIRADVVSEKSGEYKFACRTCGTEADSQFQNCQSCQSCNLELFPF